MNLEEIGIVPEQRINNPNVGVNQTSCSFSSPHGVA